MFQRFSIVVRVANLVMEIRIGIKTRLRGRFRSFRRFGRFRMGIGHIRY